MTEHASQKQSRDAIVMIASDSFATHWNMSSSTRFLVFVSAEHFLLALKYLVERYIPDVPQWVENLHRRHHHIGMKLKGMDNDHDDHLAEEAEEIDVTIHPNAFRFARHRRGGPGSGGGGGRRAASPIVASGRSQGDLATKRITV